MTDPLDDLRRAFERGTPEPDAERRRATLARAQELFDRVQDSGAEQRRTDDRANTWAATPQGVRHMFNALTSRPALVAAGVLAAVGFAALLVNLSRSAAPGPPVVVSDAGVPPGRGVASEGDLEAARTVAPVDEGRDDAGVELAESPAAPAQERTSPVSPGRADLERQRETPRARWEAAPDRRDGAIAAAGVRPGEVTVTADPALVSSTELAAEPPLSPVQATPALAVSAFARAVADPVDRFSLACPTCDRQDPPAPDTEAFANEDASPVKVAREAPVSTFSIDVDTASYSVVRSSLMNGYPPSPESVRIEEMVNYFPYAYPAPGERGAPFRPTVTVSETPWNPDTLLMHIGIQGRLPATKDRPPLNLVFLIDTSGSMDQPNKLPLLVQSFRLMLGRLDPADEVAIVTYAGSAGLALDATASGDRGAILAALDRLRASGSTAGAAGIQLAYRTAGGMAADGEVTRVILATDGDFNVGISDPEQLEGFIARQRDSGVYLSVLGFGRGNLDDAAMQALAQSGNGQAAYIDTLGEAQKVLVDQLVGTLFPIADDVKIQVEFNPAEVAEYRLIGYETRGLRREDFSNDRVDAGEIGAGRSVTAIYEVTPVGSPAVLHEPLRYADRSVEAPRSGRQQGSSGELAFLRLRYKEPGEDTSQLIELPILRDIGETGADRGFAAAIAGFGQLLRDGVYTGDWTWTDAIALAEANTGTDPFGYRREAVTLMRLAESLAEAE